MVKIFKNIAILEGISFLILIANMIFFKTSNPELYHSIVKPLGWVHGALFIGYVVLAVLIMKSQKWSFGILSIVLIASLIPFATFFVEKKYLQIAANKQ